MLIGGRLYVTGGLYSAFSTGVPQTEIYNPVSGTWTQGAPVPHAYGVSDGELLVSGGLTLQSGNVYLTNQGYAYDPATNSWSALPSQPQAEDAIGSACGFYAFGGTCR